MLHKDKLHTSELISMIEKHITEFSTMFHSHMAEGESFEVFWRMAYYYIGYFLYDLLKGPYLKGNIKREDVIMECKAILDTSFKVFELAIDEMKENESLYLVDPP